MKGPNYDFQPNSSQSGYDKGNQTGDWKTNDQFSQNGIGNVWTSYSSTSSSSVQTTDVNIDKLFDEEKKKRESFFNKGTM